MYTKTTPKRYSFDNFFAGEMGDGGQRLEAVS